MAQRYDSRRSISSSIFDIDLKRNELRQAFTEEPLMSPTGSL
jgi:hypothetical protein